MRGRSSSLWCCKLLGVEPTLYSLNSLGLWCCVEPQTTETTAALEPGTQTWVPATLDGNQTPVLCPFLTSFASSDMPLFTGHVPFCLFLPKQTTHLLTMVVPMFLAPQSATWDCVFSSESWPNCLRPASGSCYCAQSIVALSRTMLLYHKEIIIVPIRTAGSWEMQ